MVQIELVLEPVVKTPSKSKSKKVADAPVAAPVEDAPVDETETVEQSAPIEDEVVTDAAAEVEADAADKADDTK